MIQAALSPAAVEYPCSDGKPMAGNDAQRAALVYALGTLEIRFGHRPDVYVSGNLPIYCKEGDPRTSVAELEALLRRKGRSPDTG